MKLVILIFICSVLFWPATADSQMMTGNELYQSCVGEDSAALDLQCVSFIRGAVSMYSVSAKSNPNLVTVCIPNEVNWQQIIDVIVADLRKFPAVRHEPAIYLITLAIIKAWACE